MSIDRDFLNKLQIASPCPAAWAEMRGDDRARFCAACEKHVYDFSKMTAAEGLALIREKEGKVCARLWRRADGTVITADCPEGAKRLTDRRTARLPWAAATLIAGVLLNLGCSLRSPEAQPQSNAVARSQAADDDGTRMVVVGALDGYVGGIDATTPTVGLRMASQDWENLPLR
ncbi:MAG TPA: hypothetical protein VL181_06685 [Holophagaceae bacterium]|jgi:anti-sigma factor RsiW|nr:hypothetical protein [Holophagaceae bacterium]